MIIANFSVKSINDPKFQEAILDFLSIFLADNENDYIELKVPVK